MKKSLFFLIIMLFISMQVSAQTSPGNALSFDGTNDYISLTSGVYFNDNTFTVEAWVNLHSFGNWCRLFDFGVTSDNNNVLFALSKGTTGYLAFGIYNPDTPPPS